MFPHGPVVLGRRRIGACVPLGKENEVPEQSFASSILQYRPDPPHSHGNGYAVNFHACEPPYAVALVPAGDMTQDFAALCKASAAPASLWTLFSPCPCVFRFLRLNRDRAVWRYFPIR